ncbi:hypothetical protein VCHC51A1_0067 [Vibrio cholerae HC-51A1]|nr:hypothetical protein VCHC02A1_0068 [Vibrio cholerae HC-02A1]EKG55197.1 hypothetical protein VCHC50A1_0068 [Vibrio cholerae HC-50A1]EKG60608.1 hypothetical protein VCHC52A1_0065 [Vibrio cholerae HC-52A1]EKG65426.1 hypothetical protein VCHC56A1_0065 [Vibrio cholerae HC-56A1]EKG65572.1 hypothetical protein VCHC55A1_0064 [Vibrio cholerae HC-55A1]EKG75118.1 hypothetical protein VCHC57A1_0065 [Vibrio cholerae HC-57A1]EKG94767.1 hypothetical protein VCHC51A1_0067 [Vibrio cholerae HC-51A1]EKK9770
MLFIGQASPLAAHYTGISFSSKRLLFWLMRKTGQLLHDLYTEHK